MVFRPALASTVFAVLGLPKSTFVAVSLLAFLAVSPAPADASLIAFDTFGAGNSYDTGFRYGVDGNVGFQAFQFIPTLSGSLFDFTVALGRSGTNTSVTQFDLYTGSSSALGTLLESFLVPNTVAPGQSPGALVTFNSLVQPVLNSGQIYWLSLTEPNAPDGSDSLWFFSDQATGTRLTSTLPAQSARLPAFRVGVTAVPEPAGLILLAVGLSGLGFLMHRRKKAA